ncbi:MAG: hypothetical protein AAF333_08580 [Planctomycetota bacterium]
MTERTAAARTLLEIDDFSADRALAAALGREQPEVVWRAVLQAVATEPAAPPRGLWRPMLAMLYAVDDTLVTDVVTAMGRYNDPALLARLRKTALASEMPTRERSRAIAALGHRRSQDVAGDLIDLTRLTEAADVQAAAYASLATLTGIERFGADRGRWAAWWDSARKLDALAWQEGLVANFARQRAAHRGGEQQLAEQLREAMRALYRASSPEDQPGTLAAMLGEPLEPTRRLGLELAQERLIDGQPFNEQLRAALRERLDDESAELRGRSAEMLRDLSDRRAAEAVAQKLSTGEEQVGRVLAAYMQLLTQMPQKSAVDPIIGHLDEPGLRADACGALAAVAREGLLAPRRSDEILEKLRGVLADGQRPSPQMVRLLGRIGRAEEWNRIERWIDDRDDIIRQAAAQAWADAPDRSLEILAERAEDRVIQPIVIRAAFDRGQNPATLDKLAANPPREVQFVPAWERALIAMAGRPTISENDALRTGDILLDKHKDMTLVDRFLTAAIDRHATPPTPVQPYHRLRLVRGENRLAMDNPDLALVDFEYLLRQDPETLTNPQRNSVYRGLIPAYLQAGRYEQAVGAARAFFEDPANPGRLDPAAADDPLIQNFLDTIRDQAERGQLDEANDLFERFMLLLGPDNDRRLPVDLAPQINTLRERLAPVPPPEAASNVGR